MSGTLNTTITGRANGDLSIAFVAGTKPKCQKYNSLIGYGDFCRPLSFVLPREDKYYNLGEARIFISQGFRYNHFTTNQKVLQIKTECIKENTRKKNVGQNFKLKKKLYILILTFLYIYYILYSTN